MKPDLQTRQELISALHELSRVRPQWRFGQLLANLATTAGQHDPGAVWDLEDDIALAAAQTLIQESTGTQDHPANTSSVEDISPQEVTS